MRYERDWRVAVVNQILQNQAFHGLVEVVIMGREYIHERIRREDVVDDAKEKFANWSHARRKRRQHDSAIIRQQRGSRVRVSWDI